ncbi:MAG: hypothetical protein M3R49_03830 [Chloroflexota bacterium]|nr:hypothetical protein [Chloroflexota bacterium]
MTTGYPLPRRRGKLSRGLAFVEDFMNWLLYGRETWLVAVLKGVPLFLFIYFLLMYIPNYAYYLTTVVIPFLHFSADVGFIIAALVGGGNFTLLIVLVIWTQAARGRRGFAWSLIRMLDFLQFLFVLLIMIPLLAFNLAGGSFIPPRFPLLSLGLGAVSAALGAAALVYLYFEYRRLTLREAEAASARSAAYSAR